MVRLPVQKTEDPASNPIAAEQSLLTSLYPRVSVPRLIRRCSGKKHFPPATETLIFINRHGTGIGPASDRRRTDVEPVSDRYRTGTDRRGWRERLIPWPMPREHVSAGLTSEVNSWNNCVTVGAFGEEIIVGRISCRGTMHTGSSTLWQKTLHRVVAAVAIGKPRRERSP